MAAEASSLPSPTSSHPLESSLLPFSPSKTPRNLAPSGRVSYHPDLNSQEAISDLVAPGGVCVGSVAAGGVHFGHEVDCGVIAGSRAAGGVSFRGEQEAASPAKPKHIPGKTAAAGASLGSGDAWFPSHGVPSHVPLANSKCQKRPRSRRPNLPSAVDVAPAAAPVQVQKLSTNSGPSLPGPSQSAPSQSTPCHAAHANNMARGRFKSNQNCCPNQQVSAPAPTVPNQHITTSRIATVKAAKAAASPPTGDSHIQFGSFGHGFDDTQPPKTKTQPQAHVQPSFRKMGPFTFAPISIPTVFSDCLDGLSSSLRRRNHPLLPLGFGFLISILLYLQRDLARKLFPPLVTSCMKILSLAIVSIFVMFVLVLRLI